MLDTGVQFANSCERCEAKEFSDSERLLPCYRAGLTLCFFRIFLPNGSIDIFCFIFLTGLVSHTLTYPGTNAKPLS